MIHPPVLVEGRLHAPYFLFLHCQGLFTDRQLLHQFGLTNYIPAKPTRPIQQSAILADAGGWCLLADDWYYTLWHKETTRPVLAQMGQSFDVFACSVGDCDRSFDFVYYRDGRLVRKYIVHSPRYTDQIVVENVGEPLPGEATAFKESDEINLVLGVAASLGLKVKFEERDFRVYVPRSRS